MSVITVLSFLFHKYKYIFYRHTILNITLRTLFYVGPIILRTLRGLKTNDVKLTFPAKSATQH